MSTERILDLGRPDGDHDCRIGRIVIDQRMPPKLVDRRGTRDWFLVIAGSPIQLGQGRTPVPAGWAICWNPEQDHRYGSSDGPWLHSCTHLHGDGVARAFAGLPWGRPFRLARPASAVACLTAAYEELRGGDGDPVMVELQVRALARCCLTSLDAAAIDPGLLAARQHCDSRFAEAIELDGLAALAAMSRSAFTAAFRAAFGSSPIDHLIEVRLRNARYLLRDRSLSVTEVAQRSGFNDLSYFSRRFRTRFGHSPRDERRRLAG